ncbi:hypothetical protein EVA_22016, partial [gut metagenome]
NTRIRMEQAKTKAKQKDRNQQSPQNWTVLLYHKRDSPIYKVSRQRRKGYNQ